MNNFKNKQDMIDIFWSYLTEVNDSSSGSFFWKNEDGYYLGHSKYMQNICLSEMHFNVLGKTDYEVWPKSADNIRENDFKVMKSGKCFYFEEKVQLGHNQIYFLVLKTPWRNKNGEIVGVIGNAMDITQRKMEDQKIKDQEAKIDRYLNEIASCMPGNFYWKDKDGRYIGCSDAALVIPGYKYEKEIIGKTDYDIWPDQADELRENDIKVMKNGVPAYFEEVVQKDNVTKYYAVIKTPLRNAEGDIVGIIGNSLDITYRKEAENLRIENEAHNSKMKEQNRFRSFVSQVVHDIRSPLIVLSNIMKSCNSLTAKEHIALKDVVSSVQNIANNLLSYKEDEDHDNKSSQHILVSLVLSSIVRQREYQHKLLNIEFRYSYNEDMKFIFIKGDQSDFIRMISNAINNAVEAINIRRGVVEVRFVADDKNVRIIVQDNGRGMHKKLIEKILGNKPIFSTKEGGYGLGTEQMRETLAQMNGRMQIESKEKMGTKISFIIPRADDPNWITRQIVFHKGDTVVILDDDSSIYHLWMARLSVFLSDITIKFFEQGNIAMDFINSFENKESLFLLTDYDLRKQENNGIEIAQKSGILKRVIVVSGIYSDNKVQNMAEKYGVKILPKQFIENIPIVIEETPSSESNFNMSDIIIIDDNKCFSEAISDFFLTNNMKVDIFYNPNDFLLNFKKYRKNTKIIIDNEFESGISGLEIAGILHTDGYKNICLLSGWPFKKSDLPDYISFIQKDANCLEELLKYCKDL